MAKKKSSTKSESCCGLAMDDDKWRRENDARVLMDAAEIRADAKRLKGAIEWARERAAKLESVKADKK